MLVEAARFRTLNLKMGNIWPKFVQGREKLQTKLRFVQTVVTISFGGIGGTGEDTSRPVDTSRRIVAFAGKAMGVLHRLGAISISRNWEVVGPIVLVRALVEHRRASALQNVHLLSKDTAVTQALIMDLSEDVFRHTLSFLGHGMKVSD